MSKKKRGLGRGLDSLLAGGNADAGRETGGRLREMPIEWLQSCRFQPRRNFDATALQELADSLKAQGMIQPISARRLERDRYEIIAGERRWRAAQMLGWREVPVVVHEASDEVVMAMALIENIQREDLSPLEEAEALGRLLDEFGMTHQQVAEAVGRSRAAVTNLLRLRELEPAVKRLLEERALEMGHARALLGLQGPEQVKVAEQVVERGLNVRQTEQLVRSRQTQEKKTDRDKPRDRDVERLERLLGEHLGTRVALNHNARGKGRMVVDFHSLDELEGILEKLGIPLDELP